MTVLEFNYQVSTFQEKLTNFALSLTNDREDAKDLFQETVLKALKYRDKFVSQTNLKAWLYTIMRNTFINDYRRKKMAQTILDHSPNEYVMNSIPALSESPSSELATKEIQNVISELEDEYRIPFMKYVEGFKYKEISDELNLPIGTVKSRIFIARKKLMSQLEDYR